MELTELEKQIMELEESINYSDSFTPEMETINSESLLTQLEQTKQELKSIDDTSTDVYRECDNRRIAIENKLRLKMGLQEKPYHILDKDLKTLIALDNGTLDRTCNEFLTSIEDKSLQQDIKYRIQAIVNTQQARLARESKRLAFLEESSFELEKLSKFKPEMFVVTVHGVQENESYKTWKKDILELSGRLQNQIRANESLAIEFPDSEKTDKRESLYILKKKIDELIETHNLQAGDN